jgi:hypothetical protein
MFDTKVSQVCINNARIFLPEKNVISKCKANFFFFTLFFMFLPISLNSLPFWNMTQKKLFWSSFFCQIFDIHESAKISFYDMIIWPNLSLNCAIFALDFLPKYQNIFLLLGIIVTNFSSLIHWRVQWRISLLCIISKF